jgi:hypothetical protein
LEKNAMDRRWLCAAVLCFLTAATTRGSLITFDNYPNGKVINNQYFASDGVSISADNFTVGHPDLSILFDTNLTSTNDKDLQQPWTGGGNASTKNFHKILIIAENKVDNNHDGLIDRPDDEGQSQPAGKFMFKFKQPQVVFGMDLIDCDGFSEIGTNRGFIAFKSGGNEVARVGFGDFVTVGSAFYDPTVHYHDNSANHLKPITTSQLHINSFDEVDVNMGWSTAIDNIVFDNSLSGIIPEPGTFLLGLPMALLLRRRTIR